ncbi:MULTISPECIES: AlbA family DNA-binding domain-containing protein [Streptomyces]|uniref:AlbA family DNA-binding domain-containing protein n=1 Tax=Streptomyces TaxID=1883 RepID=UPI00340509C7
MHAYYVGRITYAAQPRSEGHRMTPDGLRELLCRAEGESHDFKLQLHDTSSPRGKVSLVCDVLSMANTPRDGDAHIVFGVKELGNGSIDCVGVDDVPDDAAWQQILGSAVESPPRFSLEPVQLDGLLYAVLTIPPERRGPYLVRPEWRSKFKEVGSGTLVPGVVYYRRGSSNTPAGGDAIRWIVHWMASGVVEPMRGGAASREGGWQRFLSHVHGFADSRHYLLVSPRMEAEQVKDLKGLAGPSWSAVLDLDPDSENGGLMGSLEGEIQREKSLYRVVPQDPAMALGGRGSVQWIFAKGLASESGFDGPLSFRQWTAQFSRNLGQHLAQLAAALAPAPVTCVILGYADAENLVFQAILTELSGSVGEALEVLIATDDPAAYQQLAEMFEASIVHISANELCAGLIHSQPQPAHLENERMLPSLSGAPVVLDPADAPWIEEELEILYLDSPSEAPDAANSEFLAGGEISWYDLSRRVDIDRVKTSQLSTKVVRELDSGGSAVRVNLYHTPGAGGTTVARRVLWDLHTVYPCVALRGNPSAQYAGNRWAEDNAERIMRLAHTTQRRVLVLAEGSKVPRRLLDDLYDSLRNRQVNAVVLQVMRRSSAEADDVRVVQLPAFLINSEADRFLEEYSRARPDRHNALRAIKESSNVRERVPFHFGLAAYGRDFLGLERYVETRIENLEPSACELLQNIALAYYYGQKGMSAQLFGEILGVSPTKSVKLARLLPDEVLDLLVEEENGVWRMAHTLLAEATLRLLLGGRISDVREWKASLPDAAIEFARLCCGNGGMVGDSELDLIQRIFIYRDSSELLGTEQAGSRSFSRLIEDVTLPNSAVRLLETLTELFPSESHLYAHLARYQAVRMHDLPSAKRNIARAVDLSTGDSVVYHMQGMIYRQEVYDLMDQKSTLVEVSDAAELASQSFNTSREMRRDNEHGYISEIQMLIRLVEYSRLSPPGGQRVVSFTHTGIDLVDTALEQAEDLLAQVAQLRTGNQASQYAIKCRAQLDELYGNHEEAVLRYQSLLGRTDVDRSSVRRSLVWVYLKKSHGQWQNVKNKDMQTIERLLRENLRERASDDRTMRLWIRAARHAVKPPTIDELLGQLDIWHRDNSSLESSYYLYVLQVLKYLESSSPVARGEADRYLEECRRRAQFRTDRTRSFEWLGEGAGISRLVHQTRMGEWDKSQDFFKHSSLLERIQGRVGEYVGPTKGWIDIGGLKAFYVPGRAGHQRGSAHRRVTFLMGFSYEGLRAWEVRDL